MAMKEFRGIATVPNGIQQDIELGHLCRMYLYIGFDNFPEDLKKLLTAIARPNVRRATAWQG